jgi:co-chaperonin GroES (HSP10)
MNIETINDNVLIRPTNKDGYEPLPGSGIQVKTESKWNNFCKGEIVFAPTNQTEIKAGDKVFYARAITVPARDEILINGEALIVKKITDIVGKIEE